MAMLYNGDPELSVRTLSTSAMLQCQCQCQRQCRFILHINVTPLMCWMR